jgi:predicted DNA-binding ArsR family transcriptional regulator
MSNDELQKKILNAKARQQEQKPVIDPRETAERKKYHVVYSRIYAMLQQNTFDFAEVADVAGMKEGRLRETLLSRLALDNMVQPIGFNPGSCYLCGMQIRGYYREEPICQICLRILETAMASLYPSQSERLEKTQMTQSVQQSNILNDLLACGAPLMALTGTPMHTVPDVLKILHKSEDDNADINEEIEVMLQAERSATPRPRIRSGLRHFGFQRLKLRD